MRSVLDVAAVGDICVDFLTPPLKGFSLGDRQLWIPTLPMAPGGNAANFALGASALGLRTGLAACLGDDATSAYLRRVLRAANVTSFLKVRRGLEAGRTVALAHADGTRQLITANGSNLALSPSDISAKVCETRHLHRAGYWWTPKLLGKPTRDLLRRARDRGAETSLDVSTDPEGWPERRRAKVLAVLPEVSVFFGNEDEVRSVFDERDLRAAAKEAFAVGVAVLAVHQGPRGCLVAARGVWHREPAVRVVPRNPTGAGDVFNAGFVYGRLQGWNLEKCAKFANAAAAARVAGVRMYPNRRTASLRSRSP